MADPGDESSVGLRLIGAVDDLGARLSNLSDRIGRQPELGWREEKASSWHVEALRGAGFAVEYPYGGLSTAFRAELRGSGPGPAVALLVEYDALPELGHACGHNLHGTMSTGAALALAALRDSWPGKLVVLGTPAEEGAVDGAGGKVVLLERGAFEGLDAAMMVHSSSRDALDMPTLAREAFEISFRGRPAHAAAAPQEGINALDAALLTFCGVNAMRQHLLPDARVHGIITKGGVSPNIVPEYAEIRMYARAADKDYLKEVVARIRGCAKGAATATGAKMGWRATAHPYDNLIPNRVLLDAFARSLAELGGEVPPATGRESGSSDMGNVSQVVPSIHPYISITDQPLPGHSREFAAAALSERAHAGLRRGAKALALTAYRVFTDARLVSAIRAEFAAKAGAS